jgi:hypothetical protein
MDLGSGVSTISSLSDYISFAASQMSHVLNIDITVSTRNRTYSSYLRCKTSMHVKPGCLTKFNPPPRHTIVQARGSSSRISFRASSNMASSLPDLPPISRLTPSIVRIIAGNPSKFTLQGTNTYLVGTGAKRILIDTGEGKPVWAERLRQVLEEEKASVSTVLLTHWHHDHVGGVAQVRELQPNAEIRKYVSPSGEPLTTRK